MTFIINQLCLILFNVLNARHDANRLNNQKTVSHFWNGLLYALWIALIVFIGDHYTVETLFLLPVSALFNRQLSFDLPLNIWRHLKWDYVSTEKDPKKRSIVDNIEIGLFGYNGKAPTVVYVLCYVITILISFL